MKLLIITESQASDLIDTLKSDQIRPRDLIRCLTVLQTLPEFRQPEQKPASVKMKKNE